jgi:hypothetical protein
LCHQPGVVGCKFEADLIQQVRRVEGRRDGGDLDEYLATRRAMHSRRGLLRPLARRASPLLYSSEMSSREFGEGFGQMDNAIHQGRRNLATLKAGSLGKCQGPL